MVVRSTANNTKPPRVVKIPTKPVMAEALGSTEAAEALPWAQQGTARLPGLRAKAEYIRAPAVNNVSTPNLRRFEERVCWNKKSINQFPIPMHKTHVYVYVYIYLYIIHVAIGIC